jgi:hypothetical protein
MFFFRSPSSSMIWKIPKSICKKDRDSLPQTAQHFGLDTVTNRTFHFWDRAAGLRA